ncbi:hypothetical protein DPMN_142412 [Dreissena polymorpha]|uniref:Uncharacterized protein n=1 Tax=Dreissena polymorpha TaxID=45954 RepID=A0A9D4GB89_DREPO|nr:hypothetical protein DPMN_142412 [Dreissena polymorpha]
MRLLPRKQHRSKPLGRPRSKAAMIFDCRPMKKCATRIENPSKIFRFRMLWGNGCQSGTPSTRLSLLNFCCNITCLKLDL